MSNENYCPECSEVLLPNARKCECGWRHTQQKGSGVKKPFPFPSQMCAWNGGKNKCPLPGAMKQGDRWLCKFHAHPERFDGNKIWERCNERMEGNANRFYHEMLANFHSAMYWKKDKENKDPMLCIDHAALMQRRAAFPGWMQQACIQIADIILSPIEQMTRRNITHDEFKMQRDAKAQGESKEIEENNQTKRGEEKDV